MGRNQILNWERLASILEAMTDPEITPDAFQALRQQTAGTAGAPVLLDVREPWEIETASLAGSVNIPMGDIPSRAHAELDPDQPIVVMCHHGARSLSVTMWLRREGFEQAQSLAGGIDYWSRAIDPTVPRY
ncbi:rhodanese-like domain-containing protein [Granulicella tundricola]|uniref:Rhodanese domain protein n=1 Tax=Granulicella tundricola (strain ATCC BAA-1859 / DSM 23138 / MP5ACTX9) TaxID=1198114 RepID=E8WXI9_GRATM|nr:rhodanese-like domain-containing protein [Granulicella tundricola]ADW68605.1 Rhodanese domain protein [Granulicella tundricola MP5ACTX9]